MGITPNAKPVPCGLRGQRNVIFYLGAPKSSAIELFHHTLPASRPLAQPTTMAAEAEYWSFPTNIAEFDQDERISYSKLDNKYIAVQDDGTEYEFDEGLKRWIPMIDEALIEEQQRGYMMPDVDADADDDRRGLTQGRKRKMDSNDREVSCARMHICSVGRPARRHALLFPP